MMLKVTQLYFPILIGFVFISSCTAPAQKNTKMNPDEFELRDICPWDCNDSIVNKKSPVIIEELCYINIKQAYDSMVFTARFELDKPECIYYLNKYNEIYRKEAKPNFPCD
ncbi:MAG: hypothetical protein ACPGVT_07985 [Maricaulaceae bacterium]